MQSTKVKSQSSNPICSLTITIAKIISKECKLSKLPLRQKRAAFRIAMDLVLTGEEVSPDLRVHVPNDKGFDLV